MVWILISGLLGPGTAQAADLLSMARPADSDSWGYIDTSGAFVVEAKFRKCFPYSEDGFAPTYDKKRKSWVFIDAKGGELSSEATPLVLKSVMGFGTIGFSDGLAPLTVKKKWGYLSTEGKIAIPPTYDEVTRFEGGAAIARTDESYVVLDTKGGTKKVDMPGVVDVKRFNEGLAPAKNANALFGFVNTEGKVAIEPGFKSVGYFVAERAWAKTPEGMVGFIDNTGAWAVKPTYRAAKPFDPTSGLARVKAAEDWSFIDRDGKAVSVPSQAESFHDFSEGLCRGKKGEGVGFFDKAGKWVVPPNYQGARDFKNGHAALKKGDKWGFIDTTGAWVVKPTLDGVRDFEKTSP